jgi:hypothetical protein
MAIILRHPRTGNQYYSPISNQCLPKQADYRFAAIFIWAVPLVFDLLLVVLTSAKAYWNATLLRSESGSPIVCLSPLIFPITR